MMFENGLHASTPYGRKDAVVHGLLGELNSGKTTVHTAINARKLAAFEFLLGIGEKLDTVGLWRKQTLEQLAGGNQNVLRFLRAINAIDNSRRETIGHS